MTIADRIRVDSEYGITIIQEARHGHASYRAELWDRDTGDTVSSTDWCGTKREATDAAERVGLNLLNSRK